MADLLSTSDVARILGVSKDTVKRWAKMGILPSHRAGQRGDHVFEWRHVEALRTRLQALSGVERHGPWRLRYLVVEGGESDGGT